MTYTGEINEFGDACGRGKANHAGFPHMIFEGTWGLNRLHGFCAYLFLSNFYFEGIKTDASSGQILAG